MDAKIMYEEGQRLELTLIKGKKGVKPIAKTSEGVICLIDMNTKGFYEYGSTWDCEVREVHDKKLIIKPITCVATAASNHQAAQAKAERVFGKKKDNQ